MKWIVVIAALLGLSSVIMGAAGDHLLEGHLSARSAEHFAVALRYHQLYSLILLSISLYGLNRDHQKTLMMSCLSFLIGVIIFSGSLYGSVFIALPLLTAGTPVGGILLMGGWLLMAIYGIRHAPRISRF